MTRPAVELSALDYNLAVQALAVAPDEDWSRRAACVGKDPHLWFNDDETIKEQRAFLVRQGRLVCWTCPVRLACLNYALRHREDYGIWAGYDVEQLRRLRARLHVNAVAPASLIPTTRTERIEWLLRGGWPHAEIAAELGITEDAVADVAARRKATA